MEEIWKPIEELDNLYFVSNLGNIKSVEREYFCGSTHRTRKVVREKILTPKVNNHGYAYYTFSINKVKKQIFIHKLVANAFVLGKTEEKNIINHKDENPLNNCADNLEWCNQKYNINYGNRAKKFVDTMNSSNKWKYPPQRVRCFFKGKLLAEFSSIREAAKFYNIDPNAIHNACRGTTNTCMFLKWKYINNNENHIIFTDEYMDNLKKSEQKRLSIMKSNKYKTLLWDEEFENKFKHIYESWSAGEITCVSAAKSLGLTRQSFMRRVKSYPEHLELVAALR